MNKKLLFMFICVLFVSLYSSIRAETSWKQEFAKAMNDGVCGLCTNYSNMEIDALDEEYILYTHNDYDKKQNKDIFQHIVRIPFALGLHNAIDYAVIKNNIDQSAKKRCLTSLGVVITGKAFSVLLGSFDDKEESFFGRAGGVFGGVAGGWFVRYWLEKENND